jgi:hypothetical protein
MRTLYFTLSLSPRPPPSLFVPAGEILATPQLSNPGRNKKYGHHSSYEDRRKHSICLYPTQVQFVRCFSSVATVTVPLQTLRPQNWNSFPTPRQRRFSMPSRRNWLWGPHNLPPNVPKGRLAQRAKWLGCEVNHSYQCSAHD